MNDIQAITELAQKYFDALYHGNADLFAEIFHPDARLYCNNNDDYLTMGVADYLDVVRGRASPAERDDRRADEVIAISVPTPTTAHLRTREVFLPKLFTDELTLIKCDGNWRIVSKVWDFELIAE